MNDKQVFILLNKVLTFSDLVSKEEGAALFDAVCKQYEKNRIAQFIDTSFTTVVLSVLIALSFIAVLINGTDCNITFCYLCIVANFALLLFRVEKVLKRVDVWIMRDKEIEK